MLVYPLRMAALLLKDNVMTGYQRFLSFVWINALQISFFGSRDGASTMSTRHPYSFNL